MMQVTARDIRILTWIGEQFIVNSQELDRLLCFDATKHGLPVIGEYFVRDTVRRWKKANLVQTVYPLRRGSHVFLTAQGIRLTALPYVPRTPGIADVAHLTHHDGVNQVRLALEEAVWRRGEHLSWMSERSLMQKEKREDAPHTPKLHRPDAVIQTSAGRIAIEVERAYKRPSKLRGILEGYLYTPLYTQIHYYCETQAIQHALTRTLAQILRDLPEHHHAPLTAKLVVLPMP